LGTCRGVPVERLCAARETDGVKGVVPMQARVSELAAAAEADVLAAGSLEELEQVRVRYLGKKGGLTRLLRGIGQLPPDERPEAGQTINRTRERVEELLTEREDTLRAGERSRRLEAERVDVTLPARCPVLGHRHLVPRTLELMQDVFRSLGFEVARGPEVEYDEYNFELLNMPPDHPARDMQDSFYVSDNIVLRTQTSPMQVRYMRRHAPRLPVRIIVPGRVYRRDDDPTHTPMFHQVEGLLVDRWITLGHLKGVLEAFARRMFGAQTRVRLRPSYFPFTEPSCEVDISCSVCGGKGCRTCGDTGWLEILGAGMVHPRVLENGGYDPEECTGFAFGMGVDRIALLRHGIDDLRLLFVNDLRLVRQF